MKDKEIIDHILNGEEKERERLLKICQETEGKESQSYHKGQLMYFDSIISFIKKNHAQ